MAVVKTDSCLLNCLREVRLEKFHRNFVERGLINCDQLGCLPMDQYAQFGVVSMEDRKRLFSIIEIIKSVKADGILCHHGVTYQDRKPEHGTFRKHDELSQVIVNGNFKPAAKTNNLSFAPKKLVYSELANQQGQSKVVVKPANNYKVAVERSAEEDLKQKQLLKHGVVSSKNSDSPMFQCKKTLNFSDPDLYSDEELQPALNVNAVQGAQSAIKVPYFRSSQVNKKILLSNGGNKSSSKESNLVTGGGNDPFQGGGKVAPFGKERVTMKRDITCPSSQGASDSNAVVDATTVITRKKIEASDDILSSRSTSAQAVHDGENTSSENKDGSDFISSKSNGNATSAASNISSATAFASTLRFNPQSNAPTQPLNVITKEFVTAPKCFLVDLKPVQSDEHEKTTRSFWQYPSKKNRNHAYFPAPELVGPTSKPMHVEQIIHSGGYDYGVPDGSGKTQSTLLQTDIDSKSAPAILYPDKIRVCVRKRPRNAKELKRKDRDIIRIRGQQTVVVEEVKVAIDLTKYIHQHVLKFDEVFSDKCTNQEVYERAVKPLIACVFDKGSAICFAFGQTGAGKTHTLMGSKGIPGMYQLAGEDLFAVAHSGKCREPLRLWISFYEIYCGHLYDLLNKRKRLHVRENGKQKVCVAGLMENPVPDVESLIKVINYGNSFRSRGSTGVNPHSSRSHALLQMDVRDSQDNKVGRLTFIDLAGSERASDATNLDRQTRIEGAEINQSLLALKECIRSIDQESGHTPYRQSKLTHILRDSFLGNSQTVMIANISPTQTACENTLNTLRYADRVQELRKEVAVRTRRSTTPVTAESHENPIPPHSRSPASKRRAPSLFHPSDIQCSSTPMKNSAASSSGHVVPPVDLSDILQNGAESPLSGHKISGRKSSAESKDRCSPVAISPIGELQQLNHGSDSVENRCRVAAADDRCHIPVTSTARHGLLGSGSPERKELSRESSKAPNPEVEAALPCTCKSEEDMLGSKDLGDELLREHRKIKTHAEMVISKVKSVIEQVSMPRPFGSNGLSSRASDPAHVLFLETKTCMGNARDNIRDFLDNEKKNRLASQPSGVLQQEPNHVSAKSVEQLEVWATHLDSDFRYSDEILPDETALRCQEEANTAGDKNLEQMGNSNSRARTGCVDGSSQPFGSSNFVSASVSNPTRNLRSWAAILQDSSVPEKTVSNDACASEELPGSKRDFSEQESDCRNGRFSCGSCHSNKEPVDGGEDVDDDEEPVEGEEVPSFVISKEVRLLQLKIQELKMQKSCLEREQRLFIENQQNDCERFKETFPLSSEDSEVPAVPASIWKHVSPTGGFFSTPDGDVYKEAAACSDLKMGGEQQDCEIPDATNGQVFPDQNGNFSKYSSQCFPMVDESCGNERRPSDRFDCNPVSNLEGGERTEEGEGTRPDWANGRETGENTHSDSDRIRFSDYRLQNQFSSGVQGFGLSTDDVKLKFAVDLACEINKPRPSLGSTQQDCIVEVDDVKVPCQDGEFRTADRTVGMQGTFTLHKNSAFTKVMPCINKSSNNSQWHETNTVQSAEVQSKQGPVEILTSTTPSLPIGDLDAAGFEPIEPFPVTPRVGSESETNEQKNSKEWNDEDGSSVDQSNSGLLEEAVAVERTRSLLVTAHEDQLTAVTHLCKQEMSLLMAVRTGQMDYNKYMESIRDILCTKSKIILALMEHINEFHMAASDS